jgi:hypothetical protein
LRIVRRLAIPWPLLALLRLAESRWQRAHYRPHVVRHTHADFPLSVRVSDSALRCAEPCVTAAASACLSIYLRENRRGTVNFYRSICSCSECIRMVTRIDRAQGWDSRSGRGGSVRACRTGLQGAEFRLRLAACSRVDFCASTGEHTNASPWRSACQTSLRDYGTA